MKEKGNSKFSRQNKGNLQKNPIVEKKDLANVEEIVKTIDESYVKLADEVVKRKKFWENIGQVVKKSKNIIGNVGNIFSEKTKSSGDVPIKDKTRILDKASSPLESKEKKKIAVPKKVKSLRYHQNGARLYRLRLIYHHLIGPSLLVFQEYHI